MNLVASSSLVLSLAGWGLLLLTFVNLLSGSLETRSCTTNCVQNYFFGSTAFGVIAFLGAIAASVSVDSRKLGVLSLVVAFPLVAVVGALFLIGNFGHLVY